ncbi:hypothetical protein HYH03_000267 [Edaphochlamys debaryana]|uniref:Uncharacterized protein n=1 Tax=Edaphochlamys debaryana TaxID=47281 RepID=A0A835YF58_9CHLO|nr:hypothetical protein HYH03_000267 [Edaphochlamys debaryana]|eukprot:KAG2501767.1 hypothetical protein HYH03_000267 [Edaphochlamys debaryana]
MDRRVAFVALALLASLLVLDTAAAAKPLAGLKKKKSPPPKAQPPPRSTPASSPSPTSACKFGEPCDTCLVCVYVNLVYVDDNEYNFDQATCDRLEWYIYGMLNTAIGNAPKAVISPFTQTACRPYDDDAGVYGYVAVCGNVAMSQLKSTVQSSLQSALGTLGDIVTHGNSLTATQCTSKARLIIGGATEDTTGDCINAFYDASGQCSPRTFAS